MNNVKFIISGLSLSLAMATLLGSNFRSTRAPASLEEKLTLEVQSLRLTQDLKLKSSDSVFLRARINRDATFELTPRLRLKVGEELSLKSQIVIDSKWIQGGNLEFKIELVKEGLFKNVLVRCAQVAKRVEHYNRSYQCTLPGADDTPFLVYSLKKKPLPAAPLARSN